jgi:hypothetical protein
MRLRQHTDPTYLTPSISQEHVSPQEQSDRFKHADKSLHWRRTEHIKAELHIRESLGNPDDPVYVILGTPLP